MVPTPECAVNHSNATQAYILWPIGPLHQRDTSKRSAAGGASGASGGSASQYRNFEVLTDFARKEVVDFSMARNRGRFLRGTVHVDRMPTTFAKQCTTVRFKMANQINPLHSTATTKGSRITSWPLMDSSASTRFASRTISSASARFSRVSLSVSP